MPLDWGNRETIFRLLAAAFAVIGKEGFRGTYGEIARLFGEPATYDAIQSQFREVSKMAEGLRAGKAGIQDQRRPVRLSRSARRRTRPSSSLDPGDLEVIQQGPEGSVSNGVPDLQHHERAHGYSESPGIARPKQRAKPASLLPSSSTSSSEARTIFHVEEEIRIRPVPPVPNSMLWLANPVPKVSITPDQIDRSRHWVVPSSPGAEEVTAFIEAEMAVPAASTPQSSEVEECITHSSLDHTEERARFRKLYSSDSHGTQAKYADAALSQSSQEHAAERARYRKLYYPDSGKETVAVQQDVSEVSSAAPAQVQQEQKHEAPMDYAPIEHKMPGISGLLGKNAANYATLRCMDSMDRLPEPRKNDVLPPSKESSSIGYHAPTTPATSYMHTGSRKCLLCNRRFPGHAFEKHERASARHREKLKDGEAVAKANEKLEKMHCSEIFQCEEDEPPPAAEPLSKLDKILWPQSHSYDQQALGNGQAPSPDYLSRSLSLPPLRQESSPPRHGQLNRDNGKRSIQEGEDVLSRNAAEKHATRDTKAGQSPRPLKRKHPGLGPEIGEPSTHAKTKHAKQNAKDVRAQDDILVNISSAALDKILELHPEIFDLKSNERTTTAHPGWQAMVPSNRPNSKEAIRKTKDYRQVEVLEDIQINRSRRAGCRNSSDMSREYFRCSSRCDDSQDEDYQDDRDEEELEEEDEGEAGEEEEEEELEELL